MMVMMINGYSVSDSEDDIGDIGNDNGPISWQ